MNKKVALVVLVLLLAGMGVVVGNQVMRRSGDSGTVDSQTAAPASDQQPDSAASPEESAVSGQLSMNSPDDAPVAESGLPAPSPVVPETTTADKAESASNGAVTGMAPAPKFKLDEPGATPEQPDVAAAPAADTAETPQPKAVAAQTAPAAKAESVAPKAEPASKPAPKKAAPKAVKKQAAPVGGANALKTLAVTVDDGVVSVRVEAQNPIAKFRHFFLKSPSRLVVDLYGDFKRAANPAVPDNKAVKSVRLGRHKDKMRVVLDLSGDLSGKTEVEKNGDNGVKVVLKP